MEKISVKITKTRKSAKGKVLTVNEDLIGQEFIIETFLFDDLDAFSKRGAVIALQARIRQCIHKAENAEGAEARINALMASISTVKDLVGRTITPEQKARQKAFEDAQTAILTDVATGKMSPADGMKKLAELKK